MAVAIADMPLREYLATDVPVSAARWEDASPDGGYPRYPDVDTTLARTGRSSVFLNKPYWREPRGVAVKHRHRPGHPAVVTAWLHDGGMGTGGQAHVGLRDTGDGREVRAGIDTAVSRTHYAVTCDGETSASIVPRTRGWHEVAFVVQDTGTEVSIDQVRVGLDATIQTATMGWVAFGSSREMAMDVSIDSVTIRQHARPEPAAVLLPDMGGDAERLGVATKPGAPGRWDLPLDGEGTNHRPKVIPSGTRGADSTAGAGC